MPYNRDGSKKKNPSKRDWQTYQRNKARRMRKTSGSSDANIGTSTTTAAASG